jgi:hypothetical protein
MLNHLKRLHSNLYVTAASAQGISIELQKVEEVERETRKGKSKRSLIWNYFQSIENGEAATCITCSGQFDLIAGKTLTLTSHLKQHHPELFKQFRSALKDRQFKWQL